MKIARTVAAMKQLRSALKEPVGFVPTMGYLHEGHLTLVRNSRQENTATVVSIFVNPAQFGANEDFGTYPRALETDLSLLAGLETDVVFMPTMEEMYPQGFNTWVSVEKVTERLEGGVRPGHFRGVATVVAKLCNIVQPHQAYFGQKDAQQVVVVKKMVQDLAMNLHIVVVPTVREPDGLAMSSRNVYLSPAQRQAATVLYQSLKHAETLYRQGERRSDVLKSEIMRRIQHEPEATAVDYVSIADPETLEELEVIDPPALLSLAVRFDRTRLLDNLILE